MYKDTFYINNKMTPRLEELIETISNFEAFQEKFSDEFLKEDARVGNYLDQLLWKYNKDAPTISKHAGLDRSYVGNLIKTTHKDRSIAICMLETKI